MGTSSLRLYLALNEPPSSSNIFAVEHRQTRRVMEQSLQALDSTIDYTCLKISSAGGYVKCLYFVDSP